MSRTGTAGTVGSGTGGLRGQPLIALVAVLGGWIGGRAATWDPAPVVPEAAAVTMSAPAIAPVPLVRQEQASPGYVADPQQGPLSLPGQGPMQGTSGYGPTPYAASPAYASPVYVPAAYPAGYPGGYGAATYGPAVYPYPGGGYPPGMLAVPAGYTLVPIGRGRRSGARHAPAAPTALADAGQPLSTEPGAARNTPVESSTDRATVTTSASARTPRQLSFGSRLRSGALGSLGRWLGLPRGNLMSSGFGATRGSQRFDLRDAGPADSISGGSEAPAKTTGAAADVSTPGTPASTALSPAARPRRWSADAWAMLRRDSDDAPASAGALPASYGASQSGAVLRYRLWLADPHRTSVYMRTTTTLGTVRQTDAALGVSGRPVPSIPIVAAGEVRLTEGYGPRLVRPVAMAVTELPPFALPAGFRGEAYLQAGYVGGKWATPFADGQMRAEYGLWSKGNYAARIGGGTWGGAQKGAARLDVGPAASVALPLGRGVFGRVSADWRFRVAGDAHPGSGPAVTLSAGF